MHPDLYSGIRKVLMNRFIKALEIYIVSQLSSVLIFSIVELSNARKLFRVLKSLIEYKKINEILGKMDKMALHKFILLIAPRIAYFFYWIFDTFIVLAKIKVLPNLD